MSNWTISSLEYYNQFKEIHRILFKISLPYMFTIGTIGFLTNTLTVFLLLTSCSIKSLKNKMVLIALALSDLLFNIALLIRATQDSFGKKDYLICKTICFLSNLAELLSSSLTVLFTIQRFAAVRYPFQAAIQRDSSPILPIFVIVVFSLVFGGILSFKSKQIDCAEELPLRYYVIDALVSFVIPFTTIFIFNILIINLIRKHAQSPLSPMKVLRKYSKHRRQYQLTQNQTQSDCPFESFSMSASNLTHQSVRHGVVESESIEQRSSKYSFAIHDDQEKNHRSTNDHNQTNATTSLVEQKTSDPDTNNNGKDSRKIFQRSPSKESDNERSSSKSSDLNFISNKFTQNAQSIRLTRMLVLVSSCFLILNAPIHLSLITVKFYTETQATVHVDHPELDSFKQANNLTIQQSSGLVFIEMESNSSFNTTSTVVHEQPAVYVMYLIICVSYFLSFASYSVNFFLYSFSGIAFRTSLRQFFKKLIWY